MQEIAKKYGFEFSIYIKKNHLLNFVVGLNIFGENDQENTVFILRIDEDWASHAEINQEFLFASKIKKNEFIAFLNDLKLFVDNHIIPVGKIFSSKKIERQYFNILMREFETKIDSFVLNYKVDIAIKKMHQRIVDLDSNLADLQKRIEEVTQKYEQN